MFNLFKSKEEKRQEQVAAYIDQQMGQAERERFEALLGQDADLQAELEAQQEVKSLLSQVPKLKAPRNFVLDPAVYGGKAPAPSFIELLYPKLRVATAAASFMFVILLGVGLLQSNATETFSSVNSDLSGAAEVEDAEPVTQAGSNIAATAPAIAQGLPTPTLLPTVVPEIQLEKVEVAAEVSEVEEEVVSEEMFDVAADEQPPAAIMLDEDAASDAPEAGMAEAPASPRQAEPVLPEGERVSDGEETQPAPVETAIPELTEVGPENDQNQQEVAEAVSSDAADLELVDEADSDPAAEAVELQPARNRLSFGAIALWFLGLLSLSLLAATFIARRWLD